MSAVAGAPAATLVQPAWIAGTFAHTTHAESLQVRSATSSQARTDDPVQHCSNSAPQVTDPDPPFDVVLPDPPVSGDATSLLQAAGNGIAHSSPMRAFRRDRDM